MGIIPNRHQIDEYKMFKPLNPAIDKKNKSWHINNIFDICDSPPEVFRAAPTTIFQIQYVPVRTDFRN